MSKSKKILAWSAFGIAIVAGIVLFARQSGVPGPLDGFAQCLKDKGAIFYGAFWCPHCQKQKALFGKSVKLLSYVECSTPDGSGQTQECENKKIESYPTWEFTGGERLSGEIPLKALAEKTGCVLPQ